MTFGEFDVWLRERGVTVSLGTVAIGTASGGYWARVKRSAGGAWETHGRSVEEALLRVVALYDREAQS